MQLCQQCGLSSETAAKFCSGCGSPFAESSTSTTTELTKKCPYCAETILAAAVKCRYCGEKLDAPPIASDSHRRFVAGSELPSHVAPERENEWNPGTAAVLSLFIPGAGQMYKGQIGQGFAWLVGAAIGYFAFVFPGIIVHIFCIYRAYDSDPD